MATGKALRPRSSSLLAGSSCRKTEPLTIQILRYRLASAPV